MQIDDFSIQGLKLITPKKFCDDRGFFSETYNRRLLEERGIAYDFVQDNQSLSRETGTVRGLHFQTPPRDQVKLVRVVRGSILDVAVDVRVGSPTYGQHVAVELSAENWKQLLIPVGFAHGFCTLEPDTEIAYKVTDYYSAECDGGILWNDAALGIDWPGVAGSQLSSKDAALRPLGEFDSPFALEG
ncbi:MAG: dTDP-4-dehydrorhamnose 3,5-epimerase [Caulobacter sp.]|nr:dTDP-4-dehydrorhamnose 3,5-epimerase [Caulobacter sp.]